METVAVIAFAFVGISLAVVGALLFGVCGLVAGIVLMVAIIGAAVEVPQSTPFGATQPPLSVRYACPGCGGDVYAGQGTCPSCGQVLPAAGAPAGPPACKFCPTCGAHFPGDYQLYPKDGSALKALQ